MIIPPYPFTLEDPADVPLGGRMVCPATAVLLMLVSPRGWQAAQSG